MRNVWERLSEMLFTSIKLQKKETALVESKKNKWFESIQLEKHLNKICEKNIWIISWKTWGIVKS